MIFLLGALFIIVPILELAIIIQVGGAIGVLPTIGLLLLDSLLGAWLMRQQGRSSWRRFNDTLGTGRAPTREVVDGGLIIFGGALLLTPGFLTDILGFILLIPPTRAPIRGIVLRFLTANVAVRVGQTAYNGAGMAWQRRPRRGGTAAPRRGPAPGPRAAAEYDIDGTAVEVDQSTLRP